MATKFPEPSEYTPDHPKSLRSLISVTKNIMHGRTNNAFTCTLTANSATTTVQLPFNEIGQNTLVIFSPLTANAAAALGSMYVSSRDVVGDINGSPIVYPTFVITHANNPQTDRDFGFILVG